MPAPCAPNGPIDYLPEGAQRSHIMRIEQATFEDCPAIAKAHVLSWQEAYKGILPGDYLDSLSTERREAMWRESLARGQPQLLVAKTEGKVAGFVAFGPCRDPGAPSHCAEIWALYLAPSAWSLGLGRMLWLAALDRLLAQGFKTVSLWVVAGNQRAIRFYSMAGFKLEPQSQKVTTVGGVQLQELRYIFIDEA